jgi:hypothetical protein
LGIYELVRRGEPLDEAVSLLIRSIPKALVTWLYHAFHFGNFASLLLRIAFGFALITYYDSRSRAWASASRT